MNEARAHDEAHYRQAIASIEHALNKLRRCSEEEKRRLRDDFAQLTDMAAKLTDGRIEIVVFGEISTGKSALINALLGESVAQVDVRGGWTKEVWDVTWPGCGYVVPGLADSRVVLIDTPGLNEVGGDDRATLAHDAATRADLILFVTDSDLNETEFSALGALAGEQKPILLVLNKIDLYTPEQRTRLLDVLRDDRLADLVTAENVLAAAADPRKVEYVIESPDGTARSEWRKPQPDVAELKGRILEVLQHDGLALMALNAAMYAADKTDRIAALRVRLRDGRANQAIWSFAGGKALAVAVNPVPVADVLGGSAVDVAMVVTLAHVFGLEMTWAHARRLVKSIVKAAGLVMLGELATHLVASTFKALTLGIGTAVTAVPQGAAAGYGSYIVGQAAKYYFEHGASWGGQAPKAVVRNILRRTDKDSVLEQLRTEIRRKMGANPHATGASADKDSPC